MAKYVSRTGYKVKAEILVYKDKDVHTVTAEKATFEEEDAKIKNELDKFITDGRVLEITITEKTKALFRMKTENFLNMAETVEVKDE